MLSQTNVFFEFASFRLYPVQRILLRYGQAVQLPPKELDLLLLFLKNPSQLLSDEQIILNVWNGLEIQTDSLFRAIANLRRMLGNYHIFIQRVHGKGYCFTGEVKEQTNNTNSPVISTRRLQVFLCHSSSDKPTVRDLYRRLLTDGMAPWLDEEDLLPGQEWEKAIPRAVKSSEAVIVCLSRQSTTKAGYVQKEIRFALDVAQEQPEGTIFIIPLRLEDCDVPLELRGWHWANYFEELGYQRLFKALQSRAHSLGIVD